MLHHLGSALPNQGGVAPLPIPWLGFAESRWCGTFAHPNYAEVLAETNIIFHFVYPIHREFHLWDMTPKFLVPIEKIFWMQLGLSIRSLAKNNIRQVPLIFFTDLG